MIGGIFHQGSGLGNQLFRYITTRVVAKEKGLPFGMIAPEHFKGHPWMRLDMGVPIPGTYTIELPSGKIDFDLPEGFSYWEEKKVSEGDVDIRGYDPEINFITDNTIIDGEFQDDKYWGDHLYDISKWLEVDKLEMPYNVCVIGFRGGEFTGIPDLFLPQSYYQEAMNHILSLDYNTKFWCVTDDPQTARAYLPEEVKIMHDISTDWRMIRNAAYAILSNSSFYILPALLNRRARAVVAPKYWARRNTEKWCMPQNYYKRFTYL